MLLDVSYDPFDFVEVTAPELKGRFEFFSDEQWRTIEPVSRFWLNVSGTPRKRKGTHYARHFQGYDLLIWVRPGTVGGVEYWNASHMVLHGDSLLSYKTEMGEDRKEVLEDAQWESWLALLGHLRYIVGEVENYVS